MQQLFEDLTTPAVTERMHLANPVPFDASEEMFHAAGMQAVSDAEDAAHTNVQFRRTRSWMERSVNHPYLGIYPSSYMWGKVAPEMVRALAVNPFGIPIPILSKPVRINGIEVGLHGSPFAGFVNAKRAWDSVELQKDSDPHFASIVNDPANQKLFRMLGMLMPATPWEIPSNFPLWMRRIAESGLSDQQRVAAGGQARGIDIGKLGEEVAGYAFGPAQGFTWLGDIDQAKDAPVFGGQKPPSGINRLSNPANLQAQPNVSIQQRLSEASQQSQQLLKK
jgi:hypothetical protein